MTHKLRKTLLRSKLMAGVGLVSLCCYYGLTHRWTTLVPWVLCLVLFALWQLRMGAREEEPVRRRKVVRY